MTAFNAANHIAGPAIVTFGPAAGRVIVYTAGDITVQMSRETWDVVTAMHGKIDTRAKGLPIAEVSFEPAGSSTQLASLLAYGPTHVGKSIFPATDETLVIQTLAGVKWTFGRAAVIKPAQVRLGADTTLYGQMSFLCLGKNNVDPEATDAFLKIESSAFADITFEESALITPGYTAALGSRSSPYNAMEAVGAFTVDLNADITRDSVARYGVVGARLNGLYITARFQPAGLTEAQLATLLGLDGTGCVLPGQSLSKAGENLVISGTGLTFTVHKVGIQSQAAAFGNGPRIGELVFTAQRTWTTGVGDALYTIA
jgi:hypothetical protein